MTKDTRLNFRVGAQLKKEVEAIAVKEGRSVAQVCDALLKAGVEAYSKQGNRFLQKFIVESRKQ